MMTELSLRSRGGSWFRRRPALGAALVRVAPLGQDMRLESRLLCSVTFSINASQRVWGIHVNGTNVLTGNGIYLIGSLDGSDNSGRSVDSVRGSGGLMGADPGIPRPPYSLSFTQTGPTQLRFVAEVGPMPASFRTISLPFDFDKQRVTNFSFNGNRYQLECAPPGQGGTRNGSGATYTSIPAGCVIPNTGGGRVGVAVVRRGQDGPITWGEVTGPVATIRVNVTAHSHYQSLRFHNHFGTNNLEFSFGQMRQGERARIEGQIIVTPRAAGPMLLQAETDFGHQIGRRDADGWSVRVGDAVGRYMCYGPYTTAVPAGARTATFRLMLDNVTASNNRILTLDVYDATSGRVLARRDLTRRQFSRAMQYQDFDLGFTAAANQRLEFRTFWHGGSYVRQDYVRVR